MSNLQMFLSFFGAFCSGLLGVVIGHFLAKDKFRFETLHKERADRLAKLYSLIVCLEKETANIQDAPYPRREASLDEMIGNEPTLPFTEEEMQREFDSNLLELQETIKKTISFNHENKIFFNENISTLVTSFCMQSIYVFETKREVYFYKGNEEEIFQKMQEIINFAIDIKEEIEKEFRSMLWVEESTFTKIKRWIDKKMAKQ